jgi:hypothetical protein
MLSVFIVRFDKVAVNLDQSFTTKQQLFLPQRMHLCISIIMLKPSSLVDIYWHENPTASVFKVGSEIQFSNFLQNSEIFPSDYKTSQPKRQQLDPKLLQ